MVVVVVVRRMLNKLSSIVDNQHTGQTAECLVQETEIAMFSIYLSLC